MIMLNGAQRKTLVTILIEVGKFTTVGMVIGYFVAPRPIAVGVAIAGALFSLCCFVHVPKQGGVIWMLWDGFSCLVSP